MNYFNNGGSLEQIFRKDKRRLTDLEGRNISFKAAGYLQQDLDQAILEEI